MASKTINSRMKFTRDTSANWTQNNPVLLNGEVILVDTNEGELRAKVGDGTKTYTQLPFSDEALRNLIANIPVDGYLSDTSTNAIQNKVVSVALSEAFTLIGDTSVATQIANATADKADKEHTHDYAASDHEHTADEIGADPEGSAAGALTSANSYTDTKIADLINSAPTTLDTLGEIATAMEENADVVEALEAAIGNKADASALSAHITNTLNPHSVTKAQLGLGNVENKSSATIRGELASENVTAALGFTPSKVTVSTVNLVDGQSALATGEIYLVYKA